MSEKIFNVTKDNNGNVKSIEFNADAFIIPNRSCKLKDFWVTSTAEEAKTLATNLLGTEPDENELCIQMWYVVDDLNCDNLVDHSACVEIDGNKYLIRMESCYLPYSVLRDKHEGDTIDITFVNCAREWDIYKAEGILITIHVTLKQRGYRYERFGSFEEVLSKVV